MKMCPFALGLLPLVLAVTLRGLDAPAAAPVPGYPIGWCTRGQPAVLDDAKSAGFEYVELALQDLLPLSDEEFGKFAERLAAVGVPARTGYNPLPADLKLVGPTVDRAKLDAHIQRLLTRAAALKLRYVILNSAANWRVPDGIDRGQAFAQLTEFCQRLADQAGSRGVTVLVEPQRSRDTNLIVTIAEALALVQAVDRPAFQMMVDYSFLRIQGDDLRDLLKVGDHLKDVHLANPAANRTYPLHAGESDYAALFSMLKQIGYRGGLSVHASTTAFASDAPRAIAFLRELGAGLVGGGPGKVELLSDDYRGLPLGMFSSDVVGAQAEYHYIAACAPKGNWAVATFRSGGSQRAWRVIEEDGHRYMAQTYTATAPERAYTHAMVVAGDDLWSDYAATIRCAPAPGKGECGVAFRYRTNRKYYFAGVAEGKAVLKKIDDGTGFRTMNETVFAEQPFTPAPGAFVSIEVTATGDRLRAVFDGRVVLEATDGEFAQGKVALVADMPARFDAVRVTSLPEVALKIAAARTARDSEEEKLQAANPSLVLWKKINIAGFGVGRNLRFGDLEGDGRLDILVGQVNAHGPADAFSEVGCLTAIDLDGRLLWQNGRPDSWKTALTNDVAMQIHDLYGDGRKEVVYCRDFELVVADGQTGKTIQSVPTPDAPYDPTIRGKRFPKILGDAIAFCDLRGTGHAGDILLKDRYQNIWAYDEHLQLLWHQTLNTGHYPFPVDLDGDGRDEVMVGYSLLGPDGTVKWSHQDELQDHADGVAWVPFKAGAEPRLICNASDEGIFFADLKGHILHHYQFGHVQNVSVADYRPDLPGLEAVSIDFWATQGIVHLFDADGESYRDFEPTHQGSMLCPVNWSGRPGEYWMLSANPGEGGLFDGWGRRVVRFPADGHPDLCYAALDLTGDCRDEIVVWDPNEIWIYTQSDSPKSGRLYKPKRNPLYNFSDYQTTVSLPGWSDDPPAAPARGKNSPAK